MAGKTTGSKFVRLVKLAAKSGAKQKTSIRTKTEEGTITLTVDGTCATTGAELLKAAAANGAKFGYKAETGFGEADGTGSMSLDGKAGTVVAGEMMGKGFVDTDEDDESEVDTDTEPSKDKAAV